MRHLVVIALVLSMLTACSKNKSKAEENVLYGKWEMGPADGDTIEFLNNNGRNIMRFYDARFITGIYTEREYMYVNGELSVQMYPSQAFIPITSFTLKQGNNEFTVMSNELYPLLSSAATLIYDKIP